MARKLRVVKWLENKD